MNRKSVFLLILVPMCVLQTRVHAATGSVIAWAWSPEIGSVTNVPTDLTNVVDVAAGLNQGLALRRDGTVEAWGRDSGWGETQAPLGLSNVVAISAGWLFDMALKNDGTVVTWGHDAVVPPPGLSNIVAIAAGGHQFCLALRADKTVVAWGWNGSGQTNVPAGLTNVVAIAGGLDHSVALGGDGTVVVWGDTNFDEQEIPPGLSNVVAISAGWNQTLALQANGMVVGWGSEGWVPAGISNFVATSADWDTGKEFLQNDGTMIPIVSGFTNVIALASGHFFVLAITVPARPDAVLAAPVTNPTWISGQFSVSAPTRYGKAYELEYKNALTDANWTSLPLVAGNGEVRLIQDATAVGPQRFYHILEW